MGEARLYLVACTKTKAPTPRQARDLYAASDWFAKARAYVEALRAPWFILSAEHGLLDPDQVVTPYETTLLRMSAAERRAWGLRVLDQLAASGALGRPVTFLAGQHYRTELEPQLADSFTPMRGLGLGEQKAWLARATQELTL